MSGGMPRWWKHGIYAEGLTAFARNQRIGASNEKAEDPEKNGTLRAFIPSRCASAYVEPRVFDYDLRPPPDHVLVAMLAVALGESPSAAVGDYKAMSGG